MKILVTGGAGFIGSNFIYYMLDKYNNNDIFCVDALTYAGNIATLRKALSHKNFTFLQGDISDREYIYKIFEQYKFDIVINFAAESHVDRSIENPEIFLKTNVIGTQVLLDAAMKYNVKRYHQVSTDEVYGDLPLDRPDLLFTESTPIHTSSPYSASKASADLLCLAYFRTYNLPITISRCSNNYGPYQFPEKLIPKTIMLSNFNRKIPVYGKGENVRDWLHVFDHCSAIDLIIQKGKIGEIYNIGGHNEVTNIEVVKAILDKMNKPHSLIEFVDDRLGHDLRYAINPDKIEKELKWERVYDFKSGLEETIKWYESHEKWIREVTSDKT